MSSTGRGERPSCVSGPVSLKRDQTEVTADAATSVSMRESQHRVHGLDIV